METDNNRYRASDPSTQHEHVLVRANRFAQSSEINEIQSIARAREARALGALFSDGDIVRGAELTVTAATGAAAVAAGQVYLDGQVRDTPAAQLTVPTSGQHTVGIYLRRLVITHNDDPRLRGLDPAVRGYNEPGADRIHVSLSWGLQGSGAAGQFYGVWRVIDGVVQPRQPAPQLSGVAQAIAHYDRDSAGGTYVVRGMSTTMLPDLDDGAQAYTVDAGAARVNGYPVEQPAARRLHYTARPDLALIDSEPHTVTTTGDQRIEFDRWPVIGPAQVRIQSRKTAQVVHGGFSGVADPLPDNAVVIVETVSQGGTTYTEGADYTFSAGQIDWSPGGAEPAPGSTYDVTYQHIHSPAPLNQDARGLTITGALPGTLALLTYHHALRRIDRIVLSDDGHISVVRGVPAAWSPTPPPLPAGRLGLASIYQSWDNDRRVIEDGVRLVPMSTLVEYDTRLDDIRADLAELRLAVDVSGRYSGVRKGLFADPMLDDSMRDAGVEQTAAIAGGWLQLPGDWDAITVNPQASDRSWVDFTLQPEITQPLATHTLPINPSGLAGERPGLLTLAPPADRWVEPEHKIAHPQDVAMPWTHQNWPDQKEVRDELFKDLLRGIVAEMPKQQHYIRPIDLQATASGFRPGETVTSVTVGGLPAAFRAGDGGSITANAAGELSLQLTIPQGLRTGTVEVTLTGSQGSAQTAPFTGTAVVPYRALLRSMTNHGFIWVTGVPVEIVQ